MTGAETTHELAVDSIYIALLQLMEKKPYNEITITDITKRAGVSRMAYYRNYESKDDILIKRLESITDKISEKFRNHKYKDEKTALKEFFETFQQEPILQKVVEAGRIDCLLDNHKKLMRVLYLDVLGKDLSKEENMMKMYIDMGRIVGMIQYCIDNGYSVDSKKIAKLLVEQ